jgi:hypothetical protein
MKIQKLNKMLEETTKTLDSFILIPIRVITITCFLFMGVDSFFNWLLIEFGFESNHKRLMLMVKIIMVASLWRQIHKVYFKSKSIE